MGAIMANDPVRKKHLMPVTIYVTQEKDAQWIRLAHPGGLVPPPTLTLHKPLEGPVVFYYAECYGLPIPAEARKEVT
jgi:hypothetical protein